MITQRPFSEENLYPLWEQFCQAHQWSDDLRLQGLKAGKLNTFEGPDFQGAEFELDGKLYHGDVEIHRNTREWYDHHHHLDRRYNSVQLHLVWQADPNMTVLTNDQRSIITIELRKLIRWSKSYHNPKECLAFAQHVRLTYDLLRHFSIKRLHNKVIRIKNLTKEHSYDQIIFLQMMRILGAPNNQSNFEHLARSFTWDDIIKRKKEKQLSQNNWVEYLLCISGLNKSRSVLNKNLYDLKDAKLESTASRLSKLNWQFSGQRPLNQPTEQLKILAQWFSTFSYESLYFELKNLVTARKPMKGFLKNLEGIFFYFNG